MFVSGDPLARGGYIQSPNPGRARGRRAVSEGLERRVLLSTVVVNSTLDQVDPPASKIITLRDAVAVANASASTTITFDAKVFATPQTITPKGTSFFFNGGTTTLAGPAAGLTLNGATVGGLISINSNTTAMISGLTMVNCVNGAVSNNGTLKLSNSTLSGNSGGAIVNSGVATLINDTVSNNIANPSTGETAVFNQGGTLVMTNCTVSNNTNAGIRSNGSATLTDTTISGNTNGNNPGGGINFSNGLFTLTNDTIANNTGSSTGGGINVGSGGIVMTNCTVSGNTLKGVTGGGGGGIFLNAGLNEANFANDIIAGNIITGAGSGPDVYTAAAPGFSTGVNSKGHNLVGKTDGSTGWIAADLTGTVAHPLAALLGPLAANGGPNQTLLPLNGSPAIDHGSNALIPKGITTDQRGLPRVVNTTVDIGATEIQLGGFISGTVFSDTNADGKAEAGEKGLAGVTVFLDANANGRLDAGETRVSTDAGGNFKIMGLPPATYRIAQVLPAGFALTALSAGFLSVVVSSGGGSAGSAFADAPANAGISGRVFDDANGNGLRDPGEAGMGLWNVFIDANNNGVLDTGERSVITDFFGNWAFTGLIAGTYTVRVVPVKGLVATKPANGVLSIKITAGQTSTGSLIGEKSAS